MEHLDSYEEAAHTHLSAARALELAHDTDLACIIASRDDLPHLPAAVHTALIQHPDWYVPYTLAQHAELPEHLTLQLARHASAEVALVISGRRGLSPATLAALLEHPDARVRIQTTRCADMPVELLAGQALEGSLVAQQRMLNTPELAAVGAALSHGAHLAAGGSAGRDMQAGQQPGRLITYQGRNAERGRRNGRSLGGPARS